MAGPPRPNRRIFQMPPAFTPEEKPAQEQKQVEGILDVLHAHIAYAAAIRSEVRQLRRQQQESDMKVSELSSKVDQLISVATDIKNRSSASSMSSGVSGGAVQEDDPEVERLAKRIDDAIAVLSGAKSEGSAALGQTEVSPSPAVADPNAPFQPGPSQEAQATSISYQDPNAR